MAGPLCPGANGKVLVAGGYEHKAGGAGFIPFDPLTSAELYDPGIGQ